jgi:hypothetical protein
MLQQKIKDKIDRKLVVTCIFRILERHFAAKYKNTATDKGGKQ